MQKSISTILMIILFSTISFSQSNKYDAREDQWKKVEQFELKGLPKSALVEVEKIYKKAKKKKNHPQIIKSLLYTSKFALTLEEDAQLKVINQLKQEITENSYPTKNILESILADLYWQYFQQNRWKFYNRTNTSEKVDSSDFRTWDLQTIFEETHTHYQRSLESALLLQQANLNQYSEILTLQKDSQKYRPTLYDFLAHRAINFYKTDERNLQRPAYKFEIDNSKLLGDNKDFIKEQLNAKDSLSQQLHALKIYKNLTLFHAKDKDPTALVDLTLGRLDFVKANAVFNDKEEKYLTTLKALFEKNKNHRISTEIAYRIGLALHQQANTYVPTENETHRWNNKEALDICEAAIAKFPKSSGAKKCASLKQQILNKALQITNEKFVSIGKSSRLLISYKNTDQLYFKILAIDQKQIRKLNEIYNDSAKVAFINKLKEVKNWQVKLRNESDYQNHKTEVVVPELDHGQYLILASMSQGLSKDQTFAYNFVQATDLALIENQISGNYIYQVVNRTTGKPIQGATVHIKNYDTGRYNKFYENTFITDKKGQVSFTVGQRYRNIIATVTHNKDKAIFGDYYLNKGYKPKYDNSTQAQIFLFTDRSIYRPGQTVHFKGIAIAKKANKSNILENKNVKVTLKDVNYQDVKTLELKTNEFGSFSGEFVLPNTGLTGNFHIEASGNTGVFNKQMRGNTYFSVEEYKRPKFETEFKPVTETYKLNDSITVNGFAKAFVGSNITDAKVVYRVYRTAQYPKWYWYYRPQISSESQEIIHGESVTDASGNFSITFKAIPDLKVNPDTQPTFNYRVTAAITDINGETRSTETIVNVGYHALMASISLAEKLDKSEKEHTITLTTNNLNGEFVPTKGILKVYKLTPPKEVLRLRPWQAPDYQGISKGEFNKLFPHDAYQKEDNSQFWEKGNLVFETEVDTEQSKEIKLKNISKWLLGKYIVEFVCKDKFDQEVRDEERFDVFSKYDKKVADNQLFFIKTDKAEYKPNEFVKIRLGSASKDITVTLTVEKNYSIVDTKIIHLSNEIKSITIPVKEKDLGGFVINYHFVNHNSFISGSLPINVPYPKHDLEIETTTFRDKLQPGQDETWSFKIKGSKSDQVTAEILASMYDASLDQFRTHQWGINPINYSYYYSYNRGNANHSFGNSNFRIQNLNNSRHYGFSNRSYDEINWFGFGFGRSYIIEKRNNKIEYLEEVEETFMEFSDDLEEEVVVTAQAKRQVLGLMSKSEAPSKEGDASMADSNENWTPQNSSEKFGSENDKTDLKGIIARKNLQETAFFYPHLTTDTKGNVSFNFTIPESLTRWKLQLLAHTKDLQTATHQLTTVTQKDLMVLPNPPRFFREGDQIVFASKIANLTDKKLDGMSQLFLYDALTNKDITQRLIKNGNTSLPLGEPSQSDRVGFTVDAKGNANVTWNLQIPDDVQAVKYKIVAKADDFTDGEENALPVLSNRMLVTETLPMWLRSGQTKTFTLDKLKNNASTTLKNHNLTLEVTSNPAWYAVQALPYLMEYPYECAEQTFSRYYANALGSHIANSSPRIQEVFKQWKSSDALLSNLEKNQELKSLIIQETPWVREAQSETEQKKRIALLFDLNKMNNELSSALRKLQQMQMSNGGFPWFKGARYPNRYITQHIASGFGHLNKLGVTLSEVEGSMLQKAVRFLDDEILEDYRKLEKQAKRIRESAKNKTEGAKKEAEFWKQNHTGNYQIQYLYMRSFYKDISMSDKVQKAADYYTKQVYNYWLDRNLYTKGMIALIAKRNDNTIAKKILASLQENAITSEELGMYWKANTVGFYWYQSPVETQSLLIEAFSEISGDTKIVDELKVWLLKNKQTNRWKTTKATTEAVYALLLQGSDWLAITDFVYINIDSQIIDPLLLKDTKVEAGTGYFKTSWKGNEIQPEMAEVKLSKKSDGIAWGALYWQYFEDLDKITPDSYRNETPLKLKKKLFLKKNTDKGEELSEIVSNTDLNLGDLIRVHIELRVDRAMEFVHMKDMRAAGFEPVNVLSQYKWQDGLGYYKSTKDAATNFFFDYLPKGIYVFEYDLRVNNKGDFSNGITTIQSMYAPEFSSHSEGVRIKVD